MTSAAKRVRRVAFPIVAACVATLGAAWSPGALAGDTAARTDEALRFAAWSDDLWASAGAGRGDAAMSLLTDEALPAEQVGDPVFAESVQRFREHLSEREARREARVDELWGELTDAAFEDDLAEALRAAVELDMLLPDESLAVTDERVAGLVDRARGRAADEEADGSWLRAYTLYSRLNLLFEETGRFRDDERRLRSRLTMLRVYTPELFHDMQSVQRVEDGEDPLPPYNALGDDWRENWAGIDQDMIIHALHQAAQHHVERVRVSEMLQGGLERVRTLVTTTDLRETFPSLEDRDASLAFLERLDTMSAVLRERGQRAGTFDIVHTVRELIKANSRTLRLDEIAILHEFGGGASDRLDEFSSFYWPDELERFSRTADGRFTGVGIQITLTDALELEVVTPVQGTPAARAGIRPGDLIREIDGRPTLGMGLSQAVQTIVGEKGTPVELGVERSGVDRMLKFELLRDVIPLYSVKGWERSGPSEDDWEWFVDREYGIGYVRVTQFINGTGRDLRRALRAMKDEGVNGIVLDLRFNGGGLLDEAVDVANLFIDSGVIVTQEDADGRVRERAEARAGRSVATKAPLVVLVNGTSASASEIVAGALQDYGRALVVGDRTFGKGSVQNVFMLAGGRAAFKLTTQYYKLPEGRLIHRKEGATEWGVAPDVAVEVLPAQVGEALELRQNADIVEFDERGRVVADAERPNPDDLLLEGIDPQLETAILLLKSRVAGEREARRAAASEVTRAVGG